LFAIEKGEEVTVEETFTAEDWQELELAPFWILAAVGGADGKIDKTERAALVSGVDLCAGHKDAFVRRVFAAVSENFDATLASYTKDERAALDGLRKAGDILARADPTQALHFKQTLVQLGVDVADASGGVLGLGGKRSRVERKALHDVAQALRMSSRRIIAASRSSFDAILVALDGSPEAEAALPLARSIADRFGSAVTLLDVVLELEPGAGLDPNRYFAPEDLEQVKAQQAAGVTYLESVRSTYGAAAWETVVVVGDPADVIVSQARHSGVDLIVMATSQSAGLKRLFEPKVTEAVVRKAQVPVLLVEAGEEEF
jgi:nucleotide-binding universal stress UspA family protein